MVGPFSRATAKLELEIDKDVTSGKYNLSTPSKTTLHLPIVCDDKPVKGTLRLLPDKKLSVTAIRVQQLGKLDLLFDKSNSTVFFKQVRAVQDEPKVFTDETAFRFEFRPGEKRYESFYGASAAVRYSLLAVVERRRGPALLHELEFVAHVASPPPRTNPPIKMELCTRDKALRLDFEFCGSQYHTRDTVLGKVSFLVCDLAVESMFVSVTRSERYLCLQGADAHEEVLGTFEVMDGTPIRDEIIPIRIFLSGMNLAMSMPDIEGRLSLTYVLSLILVDKEKRKYFRSAPIDVFRLRRQSL